MIVKRRFPMSNEMKVYSISKSGGTPGVLNALVQAKIFIRRFVSCEPGCITVPLTEEEVKTLQALGCVVKEAETAPQQPYLVTCPLNVLGK